MTNPYYVHSSGVPVTQSRGSSATVRSELDLVEDGFDAVKTAVDLKAPTASPVFTGVPEVPAPTIGASPTTKTYVDGLAFSTALPNHAGKSGLFVTTNGSTDSWGDFQLFNRIINGGMAIDRRNEGSAQTFTAAAALAYCVDRWYGYCTGANVTGQRVAGSVKSQYRYQFTGAASVTAIGFGQRIEAANSYDMNTETATFGVDLANSLLTSVTWTAYYANTADTFGTLASPTRTQIATGTFTVTSTVTRYTASITIPAAAVTGIEIVLTVGAQISGTWTVGDVSLERGTTAGAFKPRSRTVEDGLCERYLPVTREYYLAGQCYSTNSAYVGVSFKVPARAAPTGLTLSASVGSYSLTTQGFFATGCSEIAFGAASVGGGTAACTIGASPLVAGDATTLVIGANRILWTGVEL